MRVKIEYTIEIGDDIRREINEWYGRPGLASRDEVKNWYYQNGVSMDDDLSWNAQLKTPEYADRYDNIVRGNKQ